VSSRAGLTRRKVLAAATGAALVRCGRSARQFPVSRVSIIKQAGYTMDVYDAVYRMVAEHKLNVRGKRIVLKPNLVEYDAATAINTHPMVVHAAYEAFRKLGAGDVLHLFPEAADSVELADCGDVGIFVFRHGFSEADKIPFRKLERAADAVRDGLGNVIRQGSFLRC